MNASFRILYQLSLSLWVGGMACFAFMVTPKIFQELSRDQAAHIVGFLFPLYYPLLFGITLLALVSYVAINGKESSRVLVSLLSLAVMINGYQWLVLLPHTTDLITQIGSFENTPKDNPLRQEFTKVHILANVLGLAVMIKGVALLACSSLKK